MYQRLQQKLQKIQISVQNHLDELTTTLRPNDSEDGDVNLVGKGETPLSKNVQIRSLQALVQALAEARQIWVQLQAQPQPQSQAHPQWRSLCTEIHKQLRLAEMDAQFWVAARQSSTALRRGQQLCDRLSTLIDYCDTGIKLNQQNDDGPDADVLP